MLKIILLCVLIAISSVAFGQNAIVSGGGNATGSGGSVSYTVGQIAYQFSNSSEGSLVEGVQQPFEISFVGINEHPEITLNAIVYPNPTINSIELKIDTKEVNISYDALLLDVSGKILQSMKISDPQTFIEMDNLTEGIYFLKIFDKKQSLKTFKIIKS